MAFAQFRSSSRSAPLPLAAQAQAPAVAGDAQRGKTLAYTCNGCHAIPNYKNVYPTYSVPKLHGQRPEYLVAALKAYKSGERSHGTMHSQAASLTEQDMADIAAYLAGPEVLTESKNDVPADGAPEGQRSVPRLPRHQRRRHHRRLSDALRPARATTSSARCTDYQKGGRKNADHGGHGRHAHASRTSSELAHLLLEPEARAARRVPKKTFFFSSQLARYFAASCFSRNVTIVFW